MNGDTRYHYIRWNVGFPAEYKTVFLALLLYILHFKARICAEQLPQLLLVDVNG
jgi:hypothetical protein